MLNNFYSSRLNKNVLNKIEHRTIMPSIKSFHLSIDVDGPSFLPKKISIVVFAGISIRP